LVSDIPAGDGKLVDLFYGVETTELETTEPCVGQNREKIKKKRIANGRRGKQIERKALPVNISGTPFSK
jgi:hypothetical protein